MPNHITASQDLSVGQAGFLNVFVRFQLQTGKLELNFFVCLLPSARLPDFATRGVYFYSCEEKVCIDEFEQREVLVTEMHLHVFFGQQMSPHSASTGAKTRVTLFPRAD